MIGEPSYRYILPFGLVFAESQSVGMSSDSPAVLPPLRPVLNTRSFLQVVFSVTYCGRKKLLAIVR